MYTGNDISSSIFVKHLEESSRKIKSGKEYTLFLLYCKSCNKYKRILSSAPAGPGGTLSCPICKELKQNGPHLEGAYGSVRTKQFNILLPVDVDLTED